MKQCLHDTPHRQGRSKHYITTEQRGRGGTLSQTGRHLMEYYHQCTIVSPPATFRAILVRMLKWKKIKLVPGSMICTEPPCTCLSYLLFPAQYMGKRFAVETRESVLIKINEHKNQARVEEKRKENIFLIQSGVYVLGTGRRIRSVR